MLAKLRMIGLLLLLVAGCFVCTQSAIAKTTNSTVDQASDGVKEFSVTIADTNAHVLTSFSNCKRIKLMAPQVGSSDSSVANTSSIFYGDATHQHDWIAADGSRDTYVHVDDPARIYYRGVTVGDVLWVRVEW